MRNAGVIFSLRPRPANKQAQRVKVHIPAGTPARSRRCRSHNAEQKRAGETNKESCALLCFVFMERQKQEAEKGADSEC